MIPNKFLNEGEKALASYNWEDIASATGYTELYALDLDKGDASANYGDMILSPKAISASFGYSSIADSSTNVERNFDIEYNLPRTVKGELLVTLSYGGEATGAGGGGNTLNLTVRPLIVRNGTEIQLAAAQNVQQLIIADENVSFKRKTLSFSVNSDIRIGDILRIEIIMTTTGWNAGATAYFYHDPDNKDYGFDLDGTSLPLPTDLLVNIPYKIDL